jgi:hypothetical protein
VHFFVKIIVVFLSCARLMGTLGMDNINVQVVRPPTRTAAGAKEVKNPATSSF